MSFAVPGLTHCPKCGNSYGENFYCTHCKVKEERDKQEKLDIILSLNTNEIEYLVEIARQGGKQERNERVYKKFEKGEER